VSRASQPATQIRIRGSAAEDVARAAAALRAARRVLVTGLLDVSAAVVTAACDVAEVLGAALDTGTAGLASPLGPVVARAGGITADAEELRDRADLVVTWFCDPETSSPGFRQAFLAPPLAGGQPRQVLAVGPEPVAAAGRHLPLPHESAVDLARLLHALLLGHDPPRENAAATDLGGVCHELVASIRVAPCVGFVTTRSADPLGLATWATRLLVRAIAHERPAFEVPLDEPTCGRGGGPGAADVLTWRYGAAGSIARADQLGAIFRPAECAAETLITRGEVDAVLAVGHLPAAVEAAVASRAGQIVVVRIDDHDTAAATLAALLEAVRRQPRSGASP
jgi:formylmethanofuran dehydrogenase subunit B